MEDTRESKEGTNRNEKSRHKSHHSGKAKNRSSGARKNRHQGGKDRDRLSPDGANSERDSGDDLLTCSKSPGSSRPNSDRDAKSKARVGRRDRYGPVSPGAVSDKDGDNLISVSPRPNSGRDAKSKARGRRNRKEPLSPGAVSERGDNDEEPSSSKRSSGDHTFSRQRDHDAKSKARDRRKGSEAVTPGAVAETKGDSRHRSKSSKEKHSRIDMAGERTGNTNQRERYRKLKEKAAMAAVTPSTTSTRDHSEEAIPMAAAIAGDEEGGAKYEESEYRVEGNLAVPVRNVTSPAALNAREEARGMENEKSKEKSPFWCRWWFWVAILLILVGGGVAAVFALKPDNHTTSTVVGQNDGEGIGSTPADETSRPFSTPTVGPSSDAIQAPTSLPNELPADSSNLTLSPAPTTSAPAIGDLKPELTIAPTLGPADTSSQVPTGNELPVAEPTLSPTVAPASDAVSPQPTTLAPVIVDPIPEVTPAPTMGQSGTPSQAPTGIPTETPSTNPTMAPFPGPSPPLSTRPTKAPTRSPSAAPSNSPTRSPSSRPSVQPSGIPTLVQSQAPSVKPSMVPSKTPTIKPSMVPSNTPTTKPSATPSVMPSDRPTDLPGVPVYGGWDNLLVAGVDNGMYFLFVPSDWEDVFGSLPPVGTRHIINIKQRRNGEVVYQGEVAIWIWNGTSPGIGIPDGFESGRRHPYFSKANGQWETGDTIVPL